MLSESKGDPDGQGKKILGELNSKGEKRQPQCSERQMVLPMFRWRKGDSMFVERKGDLDIEWERLTDCQGEKR